MSEEKHPSTAQRGIAGTFGGICSVLATHPLDTMRIRIQTGLQFKGSIPIHALYQGIVPPLLVVTPLAAICFSAYGVGLSATKENQILTEWPALQSSMAGGFAAIPTLLLSVPTERIKILMQTHQSLSLVDAFKKIAAKRSMADIYRGLEITLYRDFFGCFFWFGTYTASRLYFAPPAGEREGELPLWSILVSGSLAGAVSWTASLPFDIVKSKIQYSDRRLSVRSGFQLVRDEAMLEARRQAVTRTGKDFVDPNSGALKWQMLKSFYRGYGFAMARAIPANAISWLGFEFMMKLLMDRNYFV